MLAKISGKIFTEDSLEGVLIRKWDSGKKDFVTINLKEAPDAAFESWAISFHNAYDLGFNYCASENGRWPLNQRALICLILYEQGWLFVPEKYLMDFSMIGIEDYLDQLNFAIPEGHTRCLFDQILNRQVYLPFLNPGLANYKVRSCEQDPEFGNGRHEYVISQQNDMVGIKRLRTVLSCAKKIIKSL